MHRVHKAAKIVGVLLFRVVRAAHGKKDQLGPRVVDPSGEPEIPVRRELGLLVALGGQGKARRHRRGTRSLTAIWPRRRQVLWLRRNEKARAHRGDSQRQRRRRVSRDGPLQRVWAANRLGRLDRRPRKIRLVPDRHLLERDDRAPELSNAEGRRHVRLRDPHRTAGFGAERKGRPRGRVAGNRSVLCRRRRTAEGQGPTDHPLGIPECLHVFGA